MSSALTRAVLFAEAAHRGAARRYTGEPYINHPVEVAGIVARHGGGEELVVAALLHDVLEDTRATKAEIVRMFGPRVATIVHELTDRYTPAAFPELNRDERKRREAERLGLVSLGAKLVKLADILSNARSVAEHDPAFAKVYLAEKRALMPLLSPGAPAALFAEVEKVLAGSSGEPMEGA